MADRGLSRPPGLVRLLLLTSHAAVMLLIIAALILPAYPGWWAWLPLVVMLLSIPGILAARTYTYRWLMMVLALPVALGVMELIANPAIRLWSAALVFFSCSLFFCLALGLRASR